MSARSMFDGTAPIGVWHTTVMDDCSVQFGSPVCTRARSVTVTEDSPMVIVTRLVSRRAARNTRSSWFWLGPLSTSATVLAAAGAAETAATSATDATSG